MRSSARIVLLTLSNQAQRLSRLIKHSRVRAQQAWPRQYSARLKSVISVTKHEEIPQEGERGHVSSWANSLSVLMHEGDVIGGSEG